MARQTGRVNCGGGNGHRTPAVVSGPSAFEMIALGVAVLALIIVAIRGGK